MKVLIIDDEQPIIAMYQEKLASEGFTVVSAINGEEGIAQAKKERPDVILLDLIMPRMNGLDVLKQLKEDSETRAIPVYILTNIPEDAGGPKGMDLGAEAYLFKADTEPQTLVNVLNNFAKKPTKKP